MGGSQKHGFFLKVPSSHHEWKIISQDFSERWNYPHAIGALDGKHVIMQAPHQSGSTYFNYKKMHSIVLLAICNAKYEFILFDIGDAGRQSDGSVYANSHLGYAIENNTLNIPASEEIVRKSDIKFPYVFLADDAFGLKPYIMKPYAGQKISLNQRVFNYRLSRARRVIENAFGIMTTRFRVFRRPIITDVEKVTKVMKVCVALHN